MTVDARASKRLGVTGKLALSAAVALTIVAIGARALAQGRVITSVEAAEARDDDRRAALEDAHEGLRLFNQRRWRAALATFERANERHAAPTLELYMARCNDQLGELLAARRLYRSVVSRPVPADASRPFHNARRDAVRELAVLLKRIPRIAVKVAAETQIRLDGVLVPSQQLHAVDVDPGKHLLVAVAPGRAPMKKAIVVEEAAELTVTFSLDDHHPDVAEPVVSDGQSDERRGGSIAPALVAYGIGGLGLGVGIVTGVMAVVQTNDLETRCDATLHCPRALQSEADATRAIATVSTVGFVMAGVGAAAGTALLIWRPFGVGGDGDHLEARAGLGAISLRGTF